MINEKKVWNPKTMSYESQNTENQDQKKEEKPKNIRDVKFDTAEILTKEDKGRTVQINTILNTVIIGKLSKTSQFELEIQNVNNQKIIIYKHAILTLRFLD